LNFWDSPVEDGLSNQNVDAGSNYVKRNPTWLNITLQKNSPSYTSYKWWINWLFLWDYPFYKCGELVLVLITTTFMECIIPKLNYNWIHHNLN
jgi:hypothetical protein